MWLGRTRRGLHSWSAASLNIFQNVTAGHFLCCIQTCIAYHSYPYLHTNDSQCYPATLLPTVPSGRQGGVGLVIIYRRWEKELLNSVPREKECSRSFSLLGVLCGTFLEREWATSAGR
ncbi:hypothetical protein F5Y10DRAFT_248529 [Nemania abortiva]|nr:hypothetical protein F5Y10DRAFT_248529 [Nemania abortiva]